VIPLYHSVDCKPNNHHNFLVGADGGGGYFPDVNGDAEEAEAASWLLPDPTSKVTAAGGEEEEVEEENIKISNKDQYVMSDIMDPYLDVDYATVEAPEQNSSGADGVVPVHGKNMHGSSYFDLDFNAPFNNSKSFAYGYPSNCVSHSVSSSSLDVGVVPDDGVTMADVSNNPYGRDSSLVPQTTVPNCVTPSAADREARVMRYREKRKNRKFEKTIRYASRKAYAETRPRIKGRFAKRTNIDLDTSPTTPTTTGNIFGFRVVPSF
jgi:hypothetical protein